MYRLVESSQILSLSTVVCTRFVPNMREIYVQYVLKTTAFCIQSLRIMSQHVPTRYKVLCIIDKRCRVRSYVREVRWYIYTSLRGQVCAHVMTTLSRATTTRQVSAVTDKIVYFAFKFSSIYTKNLPNMHAKFDLKSINFRCILQSVKTVGT